MKEQELNNWFWGHDSFDRANIIDIPFPERGILTMTEHQKLVDVWLELVSTRWNALSLAQKKMLFSSWNGSGEMMKAINNKKKIHNIVASIVLAEPMRRLKNEFMIGIRGYLRSTPEDDRLLIEAEHAARKSMEDVLMEDNPFHVPNLDAMYEAVCAFVKENQGEKGFVLTDVKACDAIYSLGYSDIDGQADEFHVKAVRVKNGGLDILTDLYNVKYDEEAVANIDEDEWESVQFSDYVYYIPTLFNIAENIWEYK